MSEPKGRDFSYFLQVLTKLARKELSSQNIIFVVVVFLFLFLLFHYYVIYECNE